VKQLSYTNPDTTPLEEIYAYAVLKNNRKNNQPLCKKALALLGASNSELLKNYADMLKKLQKEASPC
jgi:hypothetical protein